MEKFDTNCTPRKTLKLPPSARGRPVTTWWVQAIGRRPPRHPHASKEAAVAEALRLSMLPDNAGLKFQVRESRFVAQFSDGAESRR
jgi:hypothetical protein